MDGDAEAVQGRKEDKMNICEAIEIIEDFKAMDDWTIVYCPPMHEALDVVVNEALRKQKLTWIPCSKELPDDKGEYLVAYHPCYWDDVKTEVKVGIDSFRGKTSWAKRKYQRVIAWMPLPQYESEEE